MFSGTERNAKTGEELPTPNEPRRIEVTIIGWYFERKGRDVLFNVQDDAGVRHRVRFGMTELALSTGQLDRFIETVLHKRPIDYPYLSRRGYYRMFFNQLVGRKIVLFVIELNRAQILLDWERVPRDTPRDHRHAPTTRLTP